MPININNRTVVVLRNYYLKALERWPGAIIKVVSPELYHHILNVLKYEYPHCLKMCTL